MFHMNSLVSKSSTKLNENDENIKTMMSLSLKAESSNYESLIKGRNVQCMQRNHDDITIKESQYLNDNYHVNEFINNNKFIDRNQ